MSLPLYNTLILPTGGVATAPAIQSGGGPGSSTGTGVYAVSEVQFRMCVGGIDVATINSSGITATITGNATTATTATKSTNIVGGSGGTIPYQSAADTTQMLANGTAGQVLSSQGTTVAPHWITLPSILTFTSAASMGGTPTEALTVTGFLATDTILSVCQKTPGGNSLPLLGYSTPANDALTAIFSADPGAGAVIVVTVKR